MTDFVLEQVATLAEQPSFDLDGVEVKSAAFREPAPEGGRPIGGLLERLRPAIARSYNTAGPGYLAYIPGGGVYAAALGGLIASATNRYVGVHARAPTLARLEETVTRSLCDWMGLPAGAVGILTCGGSLSNFSAIVTARHARLGEDLAGGTIYCSHETHHCVAKARASPASPARPCVSCQRTPASAWSRATSSAPSKRTGRAACGRSASSRTSAPPTRAPTRCRRSCPSRTRADLWVHADAAYGGFFRLAPGGEDLLRGIEECDSITLDPQRASSCPTASARCS